MNLFNKHSSPDCMLHNSDESGIKSVNKADHSAATLHQMLTEHEVERISALARGWILAGYAFWIGSVVSAIIHLKVDMFYLAFLGISSEIVRQLCVQLRGARLAAETGDMDLPWLPALVELEAASNGDIQIACRLKIIRTLSNLTAPNEQVTDQTFARLRKKLIPATALQNPGLASAVLLAHLKCKNGDVISDAKTLRMFPISWQLRRTVNQYIQVCCQVETTHAKTETMHSSDTSLLQAPVEKHVENNGDQSNISVASMPNYGRHKMRHKVLAAAFIVFTPYGIYQLILNAREHHVLPAMGGMLLAITPILLSSISIKSKHLRDLKILSHSDDQSSICPLIDALNWPEPYAKKLAINGLTRLLPRVKANESGMLDVPRRAVLYQWLQSGLADEHEEFIITILKCLEQIGDGAAIKHVERLAYDTRPSAAQKRVQSAALVCLNYLHVIEGNNQNSTTLLRAADFNTTDAEKLLRATGVDLDNNNLLQSSRIPE